MANHFCAFVLYDCVCDIDHESVTNYYYLPISHCIAVYNRNEVLL